MQGRVAAWVFDNVPMPSWAAPWVFGIIIGRWPRKARPRCPTAERLRWLQETRELGYDVVWADAIAAIE